MKPIRTENTSTCYQAEHPKIGDLWVQRLRGGACYTVWDPSPTERELLAAGGRIRVLTFKDPPPALAVQVIPAEESAPIAPYRFKHIPELDDPERSA